MKNFSKRQSSSMISFHKPDEILYKFNQESNLQSITEILSCNPAKFNTNMLIDVLHTCSYKFDNELRFFDNTHYHIVRNEKLLTLFFLLLSKGRFITYEHVLPFLRSYDIFRITTLDNKCWEIIGRVLNNCMNYYNDNDLVEICYHLINIMSSLERKSKEIDIFWERIIIQSPNWFTKLHKIDIITLIYLLHVCKNKRFLSNYVVEILSAIKESEDFFYRVEDLSVISFLIQTMESNNIFDQDIIKKSVDVISTINLNNQNVTDVVNLIWSYGNFVMKFEMAKDCMDKLDIVNLKAITVKVKCLNEKLFVKLNKSLYLLGLPITDVMDCDIKLINYNELFEKELIDSFHTIELVKDPNSFFNRFSLSELERINLPDNVKVFYGLTYFLNDQIKSEHLSEYFTIISHLKYSLSQFFNVQSSEKHELLLKHSNRIFGVIPCHFTDFLYPEASDAFINSLKLKNRHVDYYKIPTVSLMGLDNDSKVKEFTTRYFQGV